MFTRCQVNSRITFSNIQPLKFKFVPAKQTVGLGVPQVFLQKNFTTTPEAQGNPADASATPNPKIEKLVDEILSLNMLEAMELSTAFKKRLGVTSEQMGMFAGAGAGGGAPAAGGAGAGGAAPAAAAKAEEPKKEEKKTFDVKLTGFGDGKKVGVMKFIRGIKPELNIQQVKEFCDALPKALGSGTVSYTHLTLPTICSV
eukprot:TRINITY_DN716_c0_g1_i1.p1 TRINITY_DN716_c0_g1~~TRINITY_DN716_c0_g1_i1.p1  ORF type:complete len:200 (-),score=63.84 TRINITY_DN716_c0_g1_i1:22-621(-)